MANTRAFKGLASLRDSFDSPVDMEAPAEVADAIEVPAAPAVSAPRTLQKIHAVETPPLAPMSVPLTPVTGRVDRRRLRKVLKTPSISLSVAVRAELHEDISEMLFARKTTWIALLDELLTSYVGEAKAASQFPK